MSAVERVYTVGIRAAAAAVPLLARGGGKLARGAAGRRGLLSRMRAWAAAARDPKRPLVWFHAPSVGEGLQALAVIERFRALRPDAQLAYTYFSPSAESFSRRVAADFADYLPLDLPEAVDEALAALAPDVLAFSKYDVWLNLTRAASDRGVRTVLLSGTLPAASSRLRFPARTLLRRAHSRLDAVAAIAVEDAERFARLGVPPERRSVMGDARFDQVWQRARAADCSSALLAPLLEPDRVTLVAGSTWPADEQRLLHAWAGVTDRRARLVLVPHEPTAEHLVALEAEIRRHGLTFQRLSTLAGSAPAADVVVVDRVGILGELYAIADVAYVGGGWGRAGIHSVLEPAAYGLPTLFGPRHDNAREASELVRGGGGFAAAAPDELRRLLARFIGDGEQRRLTGAAASSYVEENLGAAERGARLVEELLGEASS
jgi:3-deoxy-D-manno-octulosonic-acid transferase